MKTLVSDYTVLINLTSRLSKSLCYFNFKFVKMQEKNSRQCFYQCGFVFAVTYSEA